MQRSSALICLFLSLTCASLCQAQNYVLETKFVNACGDVLKAPRIELAANTKATAIVAQGCYSYHVTIKAGDGSDQATHMIEAKILRTSRGKTTTIAAPQIVTSTGTEASVEVAGIPTIKCTVSAAPEAK